jgi:hypothetical protein
MLSKNDYELIEKQLLGTLNNEESLLFEDRMKDLLFAEEFRLYQNIRKASVDIGRSEIREEFVIWDQEETVGKKINLNRWRWMKIAATLLLLISMGILVTYLSSSKSPQQLYLEYYQPYPNLIDPLQKGEFEKNASLSQLYEMADYSQAEKMAPRDSLEAFYLALSHLSMNQFETAITELKPIADNASHRFQKAAQWYLALAYLQTEPEKSLAVLSSISQSDNHDFSKSAGDLLKKLN